MTTRYTFLTFLLALLGLVAQGQTVSQLGFYSPLPSTFEGELGPGGYLFVSQNGLKVFDVRNPFNVIELAQIPYSGRLGYQLEVSGSRAYLSHGSGGVVAAYSLANPTFPALLGEIRIPATSFMGTGDLLALGNSLFLGGFDTLYVLDVTANTPQLIRREPVRGVGNTGITALAADGSNLFVQVDDSILVYDVSTPAAPTRQTAIANTHLEHKGLAVDPTGHRLFTPWLSSLHDTLGFDAYDVASAATPVRLFSDRTSFSSGEYGVTAYYSNTLLVSEGGSLAVFDVRPTGHGHRSTFSGTNVPNSSVSLAVQADTFYHVRRGGIEVLRYAFSTVTATNGSPSQPVHLSPNPASTEASVQIAAPAGVEKAAIRLKDLTGKTLLEAEATFANGLYLLDLPPLPAGVYPVSILTSQAKTTTRLVIE